MKITDWKHTSVGNIVAEDFAAAKVFKKYGIDFAVTGKWRWMRHVLLRDWNWKK